MHFDYLLRLFTPEPYLGSHNLLNIFLKEIVLYIVNTPPAFITLHWLPLTCLRLWTIIFIIPSPVSCFIFMSTHIYVPVFQCLTVKLLLMSGLSVCLRLIHHSYIPADLFMLTNFYCFLHQAQ